MRIPTSKEICDKLAKKKTDKENALKSGFEELKPLILKKFIKHLNRVNKGKAEAGAFYLSEPLFVEPEVWNMLDYSSKREEILTFIQAQTLEYGYRIVKVKYYSSYYLNGNNSFINIYYDLNCE